MSALPVTIFFDFTCPFSYVTMVALQGRAAAGDVVIRARAVERFPAPVPIPAPSEELEVLSTAHPDASGAGLILKSPDFRPRTRKAHEAAAFAAERGLAGEMRSAIFSAYWTGERDIGRIDVLAALGESLGMDREDLRIALDIDQYREAVLHDLAVAERLRIVRTPTLFFGSGPDATILVGAQSAEDLDRAITRHEV